MEDGDVVKIGDDDHWNLSHEIYEVKEGYNFVGICLGRLKGDPGAYLRGIGFYSYKF
jgi:hypothetical protein